MPPYRPGPHCVHVGSPVSEYVPSGQIAAAGVADVEPMGHAYPALQLVHDVAPSSEKRPAGQEPEHAADGSAVVAPKVPAGHDVHDALPARLYLPAPHAAVIGFGDVEPRGHA